MFATKGRPNGPLHGGQPFAEAPYVHAAFSSNGQLASVGLAHYLPEVLREAIEDERELIGDHVHSLHVTPRFFAGASESLPPPGNEFHLPRLPQFRVPGSSFLVPGSPSRRP